VNNLIFWLHACEKNYRMTAKLAKIISVLLQPMLMPIYGILLMLALPTYLQSLAYPIQKAVVLIVILSTLIAPILVFLLLVNMKVITDLRLRNRKERTYPYIATIVLYSAAAWVFYTFPIRVPFVFSLFIILNIVGLCIQLIANFILKVSAHLAGITGTVTFLAWFFYINNLETVVFAFVSVFIIGLVAWARLYLNAHTPKETLLGFVSGLTTGLIPVIIY